MAYNFSANQEPSSHALSLTKFDDGYRPKRLRNWEIPKWYPEPPKKQTPTTKFIADSRGHLLPGIPKSNPWNNFRGTWDLPKRITRKIAEELTAPTVKTFFHRKRAPSDIKPQIEESCTQKLPALGTKGQENFLRRNKSCSALDLSEEEPVQQTTDGDYEGASFEKEKENIPNIEPGTISPHLKNLLQSPTEIDEPEKEPVKATNALMPVIEDSEMNKIPMKSGGSGGKACRTQEGKREEVRANQPSNFRVAKMYHNENLKHQPLPDAIHDRSFKFLTSNRHPNPAIGLDGPTITTAIGMKPSGTLGPTKCSKMKIYRPKTSLDAAGKAPKIDSRPKTTDCKKVSSIDLAICWDLKPDSGLKTHRYIDGSKGGEAPAVFAVVPVESEEDRKEIHASAEPVAEFVKPCIDEDNVGTLPAKNNKPTHIVSNQGAIMAHVKPPVNSRSSSFHSLTPISAEIARKHPKTAWYNEDTGKALTERLKELENKRKSLSTTSSSLDSKNSNLSKEKHHQSTPNLNHGNQAKSACSGSKCGSDRVVANEPMIRNDHRTNVKMPKMRQPFQKKNYAISTLIPPFSLWPDHKGQEYPEHWRLASVYQHSYKPLDSRKKPLLASVFQ